ncbi:helix-turn-helix domain-containing protein [Flexivirga alba]|uniref:Helix-turn-helix domain-containing protein n=1 Tax=Flexivirga alba TaxID=702742 RepID=A0ABW2AMH7_9MICO
MSDIEKVIGANIRENRERKEITQSDLGDLVAEHLGRPWPRQAISAAEKGGRSFTAAEVLAFAAALDTKPGALFEPTSECDPLALALDHIEEARKVRSRARWAVNEYVSFVSKVAEEARVNPVLGDALLTLKASWEEQLAQHKGDPESDDSSTKSASLVRVLEGNLEVLCDIVKDMENEDQS